MPKATDSFVFKPFVPKTESQPPRGNKRVRPAIPASQRKRVRLACEACRQKKEKCDEKNPCQRCARDGIVCVPSAAPAQKRLDQKERTQLMQLVIERTLGVPSLTDSELQRLADSVQHVQATGSNESMVHVESSLSTFSRQLEQELGTAEHQHEGSVTPDVASAGSSAVDAITEFCRSPSPSTSPEECFVESALAALPARVVADHLISICFQKVQCNSFYAEEQWVHNGLGMLYMDPCPLSGRDFPMVTSLLMMLALGSQFSSDHNLENLGHIFYKEVTSIISSLIDRSDFESIRACLLLSTYLFPVDHSGKAYTYLGLALHMAMSNKMHERCHDEMQIRVWWTLYTFYQRARIYHGHPRSLSSVDVTVRRPQPTFEPQPLHGVSNFDNQVALIEITLVLEETADEIASLRNQRSAASIFNLLTLRRKFSRIESQLPQLAITEDMAHFRLDVHLHLFYWHARLYLGRPFLLDHTVIEHIEAQADQSGPAGIQFAKDAVSAAFVIIELCQSIQDKIGLSRASYVTEFTSCRAAMLVLVARGISDKSGILREKLSEGLVLLQQMSKGQGKAHSETRVIATLQRAITRLHNCGIDRGPPHTNSPSNEPFKAWEMLWQQQSPQYGSALPDLNFDTGFSSWTNHSMEATSSLTHMDSEPISSHDDYDTWNVMFNTQLDEFSLLPLDSFDIPLTTEPFG